MDLPILFSLFIPVRFAHAEEHPVRRQGHLIEHRFIVGIGNENEDIFCLGAIVAMNTILTMASCFNEDNMEYYDFDLAENADPSEMDQGKGQELRNMLHGGQNESTTLNRRTTPTPQPTAEDEIEYGGLNKHSLYRINSELRVFVRLAVRAGHAIAHPKFKQIENADLWKNDLAILHTIDGTLDITKNEKIRPILLYTATYSNYLKSMNEEIINSEKCQVIGLIEYADLKPYTARDTDVELVPHEVLMDYNDCNSTSCPSFHECLETGHHIARRRRNPLPYFVRGSPLVCGGQLLSFVNVHSQCDATKYAAEFPEPQTISFFNQPNFDESRNQPNDTADNTVPEIPKSSWIKNGSPPRQRILSRMDWALAITTFNLGTK